MSRLTPLSACFNGRLKEERTPQTKRFLPCQGSCWLLRGAEGGPRAPCRRHSAGIPGGTGGRRPLPPSGGASAALHGGGPGKAPRGPHGPHGHASCYARTFLRVLQTLFELWQLGAVPTAPGSLFQCSQYPDGLHRDAVHPVFQACRASLWICRLVHVCGDSSDSAFSKVKQSHAYQNLSAIPHSGADRRQHMWLHIELHLYIEIGHVLSVLSMTGAYWCLSPELPAAFLAGSLQSVYLLLQVRLKASKWSTKAVYSSFTMKTGVVTWLQKEVRQVQQAHNRVRFHRIIQSQNAPGWKGPQGSWSSNPPPQAGPPTSTFNTRPGCPGPHPTWPWTPPGTGHPQRLWSACSSTSVSW